MYSFHHHLIIASLFLTYPSLHDHDHGPSLGLWQGKCEKIEDLIAFHHNTLSFLFPPSPFRENILQYVLVSKLRTGGNSRMGGVLRKSTKQFTTLDEKGRSKTRIMRVCEDHEDHDGQ